MPGGRGNRNKAANKGCSKKTIAKSKDGKSKESKDAQTVANVNTSCNQNEKISEDNMNRKRKGAKEREAITKGKVPRGESKEKETRIEEKGKEKVRNSQSVKSSTENTEDDFVEGEEVGGLDPDNCLEISVSKGNESYCQSDYDEEGEITEMEDEDSSQESLD